VKSYITAALIVFISIFTVACSDSDTSSANSTSATKILAVGDSIGTGYDVASDSSIRTPWPTLVQSKTGIQVVNYSREGRHAAFSVSTVEDAILTEQPSHLIIMLGTNDSNNGSVSGATNAMQAIVEIALANSVIPIVGTIPPRNSDSALISSNYRALGVAIADVEAAFGDGSGLFQSDDIHPNDAGQEVIANTFVSALEAN